MDNTINNQSIRILTQLYERLSNKSLIETMIYNIKSSSYDEIKEKFNVNLEQYELVKNLVNNYGSNPIIDIMHSLAILMKDNKYHNCLYCKIGSGIIYKTEKQIKYQPKEQVKKKTREEKLAEIKKELDYVH